MIITNYDNIIPLTNKFKNEYLFTDIHLDYKELELKRNLNKKYDELLSENIYLNKIINTFERTIKKFISWVFKKFAVSEEDTLIRGFQQETNTFLNPDKQIEYEENEEELMLPFCKLTFSRLVSTFL